MVGYVDSLLYFSRLDGTGARSYVYGPSLFEIGSEALNRQVILTNKKTATIDGLFRLV